MKIGQTCAWVALVFLAPGVAYADEERGLSIGLRTGYGAAVGDAASGRSLASVEGWMLPLWLDVGYRIFPELLVGAFVQYGITSPPSSECPLSSCIGDDLRIGVEAEYHLRPHATVDPWFGLGVGYEWARVVSATSGSADEAITWLSGFQFVDVQLGADFRVLHPFPFGPFLDASLGEFNSMTTNATGVTTNLPYGTALHGWIILGVRGRLEL